MVSSIIARDQSRFEWNIRRLFKDIPNVKSKDIGICLVCTEYVSSFIDYLLYHKHNALGLDSDGVLQNVLASMTLGYIGYRTSKASAYAPKNHTDGALTHPRVDLWG